MSSNRTIYFSFSQPHTSPDWINQFLQNFRYALKNELKSQVICKIKGDDFVSLAQQASISPADLFVLILSDTSGEDEDFQNDLLAAESATQSVNENITGPLRIFKVLLSPNSEIKQPQGIASLRGYRFFDQSGRLKKNQAYNFQDLNVKTWSRILDLVHDIKESIELTSSDKPISRSYVYLGHTSVDQNDNRDKIRRELQHFGFGILPLTELPSSQELITQQVDNCLEHCNLFIQILGENYGAMTVEGKNSAFDIENLAIRNHVRQNPGKNRLIWIPSDVLISDSRQELFINRVKRDDSDFCDEIIEASAEEFINLISYYIKKDNARQIVGYSMRSAYLIAKPMVPVNFIEMQAARAKVTLKKESDPGNKLNYSDHLLALEEYDYLVVYDHDNDNNWFNSKIGDIVKTLGKSRKSHFKGIALVSKHKLENTAISQWVTGIEVFLESDTSGILKFFEKIEE